MDAIHSPKRRKISTLATMHFDQIPDDCLWNVVTFLLDFEKAIVSACSKHLRYIVQGRTCVYGPVLYHPRSVFGPQWLCTPIPDSNVHSKTMQGVVILAGDLPRGRGGYKVDIRAFARWRHKVFVVISCSQDSYYVPSRLYFGSSYINDEKIDTIYTVCPKQGSYPPIRNQNRYVRRSKRLIQVQAKMCVGCGDLYGLNGLYITVPHSRGIGAIDVRVVTGLDCFKDIDGPWSPVIRDEDGWFVECSNCKNCFCHRCAFGFSRACASLYRMNEVRTLCPLCFDLFECVRGPTTRKPDTLPISVPDGEVAVIEQGLSVNVGAMREWLENARNLSNGLVKGVNALAEQVGELERQVGELERQVGELESQVGEIGKPSGRNCQGLCRK